MPESEKKYTILIVPSRPGRPWRAEIGVKALKRIAFIAGFAVLGIGLGVVDYVHAKMSLVISQRREEKMRRGAEVSQKEMAETMRELSALREESARLQPASAGFTGIQDPLGASIQGQGGVAGPEALRWNGKNDGNIALSRRPRLWPLKGVITSEFGVRSSPFNGESSMHYGLDIAAEEGTDVLASAGGTVTFAGEKDELGLLVILDHGSGFSTQYGHLGSFRVATGDAVEAGKPVGQVGMTGKTTGPHVHFELRFMDIPVDPRPYLPPDPGITTQLAQGP